MKTLRYAFWAIVGLCLIMVGVANRRDGYREEMVGYLQPFLNTCASVTKAIQEQFFGLTEGRPIECYDHDGFTAE